MNNDLAKPCPESDPVLNTVHELVSKMGRRRDGIILGSKQTLVDRLRQIRPMLSSRQLDNALQALLDTGAMEEEEGRGFLVREKFPGSFRPADFFRREGGSLVAKRLDADDANCLPAAGGHEVFRAQRGRHQPRVDLCRVFFPNLVEDHGLETIPRDVYWKGLYRCVKDLEYEYKVTTPFVRRMMEEFVRHPAWCQRSHQPAYRVFMTRRQELVKLVRAQEKRDPGNRRYSKGRDWLGDPSPRHNHGAEYWLGYA